MSGTHILLVDDRIENISFVVDYLRNEGYHLRTALSGSEALQEMENVLPHCVLLDLEMPGMDGLEVLQAMRRTERLAQVPVIIVSAHPEDEIEDECLEAGATAVMSKPLRLRELRKLLVDVLSPAS
jgi:two-component system response regulator (stage 0 sporulation protein F)